MPSHFSATEKGRRLLGRALGIAGALSALSASAQNRWVQPTHAESARAWAGAAALALDAAGHTYVGGAYADSVRLGAVHLYANAQQQADVYVARLSAGGQYDWVTPAAGPGRADITALAATPTGEVVVTGSFSGKLGFGADTLVGPVNDLGNALTQTFVARLSAQGHWLWAHAVVGTRADEGWNYPTALALDAAGNAYLTGVFADSATLGNVRLGATDASDGYVASLSAQGQWRWATAAGGTGYDGLAHLAFTPTGLLVCGAIGDNPLVPGLPALAAGAGLCPVMGGVDPATGQWQWAQTWPQPSGYSWSGFSRLASDPVSGDVFASGFHFDTIRLGNIVLPADTVQGAAFVARCNTPGPAGLWTWAAPVQGTADVGIAELVYEPTSQTLLAGGKLDATSLPTGSGNAVFGPFTTPTVGPRDGFVAALDPAAGIWRGVVRVTGAANDDITGIRCDNAGLVCLTGSFDSPSCVVLGQTVTQSLGRGSGFVTQLPLTDLLQQVLAVPKPQPVANAFSLAPNPAHSPVSLTVTLGGAALLEVFSATGQRILTQALPAGQPHYTLPALPAGLYLVRLGGHTQRLIVE